MFLVLPSISLTLVCYYWEKQLVYTTCTDKLFLVYWFPQCGLWSGLSHGLHYFLVEQLILGKKDVVVWQILMVLLNRGSNCHLTGSQSYIQCFAISLQLYTLKINKYTSVSGHNSFEGTILAFKWAVKGKPQGLKSQKTKKYTSLLFNFFHLVLFEQSHREIWLLFVESSIANPTWRLYTSSWQQMDIFALGLFQRASPHAFQRTNKIKY